MFNLFISVVVFLSLIANLPQIYRILSNQSSEDVSLTTWSLWALITTTMGVHAIMIKDVYFAVSQIGQAIVNFVMVGMILRYRRNI